VRVNADEQRAVDAALAPVKTDRLANRQDMRFVKGIVEDRPTMPEVPNATRCDGTVGSGLPVKYAVTSRGTLTSVDGSIVLPASGLIWAITSFSL
jgi:hypothetical protein